MSPPPRTCPIIFRYNTVFFLNTLTLKCVNWIPASISAISPYLLLLPVAADYGGCIDLCNFALSPLAPRGGRLWRLLVAAHAPPGHMNMRIAVVSLTTLSPFDYSFVMNNQCILKRVHVDLVEQHESKNT
jgi:hypothetical protein